MKTLAVNLAGIKSSAKDGSISLNKTAQTLREQAGIDVYSDKQTGQVKDMVEILTELEGKWDTLREDQQLGLSEAIAGKLQSNVFQSLMQNFDTFEEMMNKYGMGEHFGLAEKENALYVDSINGKLAVLKATWVDVASTIFNSDTLKDGLDGLNSFSEGLGKILKGGLGSTSGIMTVVASIATFKTVLSGMKNVSNGLAFSSLFGSVVNLDDGIRTTLKSTNKLTTGWGLMSSAGKAAFAGVAVMGVGMLITYVNKLNKAEKQAYEDRKENIKAIDDNIKSMRDEKSGISEIANEYDTLTSKAELTTKELERLNEIKQIIAEKSPSLVEVMDEDGNPIINLQSNLKDYITDLDTAIGKQSRLKYSDMLANQDYTIGKINSFNTSENASNSPKDRQNYEKNIANDANYYNKLVEIERNYQSELDKCYKEQSDAYDKYLKSDGDKQSQALRDYQLAKNKESQIFADFASQYDVRYSEIKELSNSIGDQLFAGIQSGGSLNGLSEEFKNTFESLKSSLDFSNVRSQGDLNDYDNALKALIRDAKLGTIDIAGLKKEIDDVNSNFQKTDDIDTYNESIGEMAEKYSSLTSIDKSILEDMFTGIDPDLSEIDNALNTIINRFGKTAIDLKNNDALAVAIKGQFDAVSNLINDITVTGNPNVDIIPLMELEKNENLPKELREMITHLLENEDSSKSSEALKFIQKIAIDFQQDGAITVRDLQDMYDKLFPESDYKITKNIVLDADIDKGMENVAQMQDALNRLQDERSVANVEINVNGQDKAQLYLDIINKLHATPELTNKLILENGEALASMESYEEVVKWLQENPDIIQKYEIKGIEPSKQAITDVKESLDDVNGKEANAKVDVEGAKEAEKTIVSINENIKLSNGEVIEFETDNSQVLESIEDIETLIKYSADMGDGKYKLDIEANTENAVTNLGLLQQSLQDVSGVMKGTPSVAFKAETGVASRKVTGLRTNVEDYVTRFCNQSFLTTFKSDTGAASRKVTGLKTNVEDYVSRFGNKTFTTTLQVKTVNSTIQAPSSSGGQPGTQSVSTFNDTQASPMTLSNESNILSDNPVPTPIANTRVGESRKTTSTPISIGGKDISDSIKYNINLLTELENRIEMVGNELSILDKKMDKAVGKDKIKYLEQQNKLFQEQIQLQKDLEDKLIRQKNYYEHFLKQKGFQFTNDGNLKNYEEKLLLMEKEAEKLDKIAEAKQKASSDYNGKDDKHKDNLGKEYDKAKDSADKYKDSLSEIKKYLDEYIQVAITDLPKVQDEFLDLNNKIEDNLQAIKDIKQEMKDLYRDSTWTSIYKDVQQVSKEIEMLDTLLKHAEGKERIDLLEKKLQLLEKQKKEIGDTVQYLNGLQGELQGELQGYGFEFRSNGDISNYIQQMQKLKESLSEEEFKKVSASAEEYLDILINKIPDAKIEMEELNNLIKDAYKEQLEVTKEVEDKITAMYKKQLEDRKKALQDELDAKLKALEKEKKAYNDSRKEMDYQRDYDDQMDVMSELQRKLDIAGKDTSLSGQKKYKELLAQIKEEQRKLDDLVQDKIDSDVNNAFDQESDRLEEENDALIKDLEDKFSDSKIAEMVSEAISSGIFVGIDGSITKLDDAMKQFLKDTGETFGVLGGLIEKEYLGKLEQAYDAMKNISDIYDKLELGQYNPDMSSRFMSPQSYTPSSTYNENTNKVEFNAPFMVIEGNVNSDVMPDLERAIKDAEKRITKAITKNYKY